MKERIEPIQYHRETSAASYGYVHPIVGRSPGEILHVLNHTEIDRPPEKPILSRSQKPMTDTYGKAPCARECDRTSAYLSKYKEENKNRTKNEDAVKATRAQEGSQIPAKYFTGDAFFRSKPNSRNNGSVMRVRRVGAPCTSLDL